MRDYQESVTTGHTDRGQSDPYVPLCFTGDTIKFNSIINFIFRAYFKCLQAAVLSYRPFSFDKYSQEVCTGTQCALYVFGQSTIRDGSFGLYLPKTFFLAETFTTSLHPLNRIWQILTGSKNSRSATKNLCFEGRSINKDCRLGFWFAEAFLISHAEQKLTKLDRKQVFNALYQICACFSQVINKYGHPGLDWLSLLCSC